MRPTSPTFKHVEAEGRASAQPRKLPTAQMCKDFDRFKPLFTKVQNDLDNGVREARPFGKDAEHRLKAEFFILGGQMAYVADVGDEERRTKGERPDSRLRVIFDNGTESNMLTALAATGALQGRSGPAHHRPRPWPAVRQQPHDQDAESGTIYVLRSQSEHPTIATNRELIHKIGVTGRRGRAPHRQCRSKSHLPVRRSRGHRDLQAFQHQPRPVGKPASSVLCRRSPRSGDSRPVQPRRAPHENGSWSRCTSSMTWWNEFGIGPSRSLLMTPQTRSSRSWMSCLTRTPHLKGKP